MRYFYLGSETQLSSIFNKGILADSQGEIRLIVLKEGFLMDKFVCDVIASEIYKWDVYCLFCVQEGAILSELNDCVLGHPFETVIKVLKQEGIPRDLIEPYKSDTDYQGMGLMPGIFPVENKEKFTPTYIQKILEYHLALGG